VSAEPNLALQLRLMQAMLEELRESVDHLGRRLLERDDRRTGEALLPLVAAILGSQTFTAPSLAAALLNDRSAEGQAARELVAGFCSTDGGLRAFGKLLARLDGVALAGCRLVPVSSRRDGRLWRVVRVSGE
jgi:hypothetical protein